MMSAVLLQVHARTREGSGNARAVKVGHVVTMWLARGHWAELELWGKQPVVSSIHKVKSLLPT